MKFQNAFPPDNRMMKQGTTMWLHGKIVSLTCSMINLIRQVAQMRVLVSNDDGIYADGIWILARQLSKVAQVIIVAPDREQSAVGTAVSLRKPLRVQKIIPLYPEIEAYSVEGTPSDSVIVALGKVIKEKVDLVISGINHGTNLGEDVLISGTVGAALSAYLRNFPAIAISSERTNTDYLDEVGRFTALLARRIGEYRLPTNLFLNVNIPNLPLKDIKNVKITSLARKSHVNTVEEGHDGRRAYYTLMRAEVNHQADKRTDIWAINQGNISISPLHLFLNDRFPPVVLEKMVFGLLDEFKK
jgi:5'-nucleotidase